MITARMNGATLVEMTDSEFAAAQAKPLPVPPKFIVVGVAATIFCIGLFTHIYRATPVQRVRNARGASDLVDVWVTEMGEWRLAKPGVHRWQADEMKRRAQISGEAIRVVRAGGTSQRQWR